MELTYVFTIDLKEVNYCHKKATLSMHNTMYLCMYYDVYYFHEKKVSNTSFLIIIFKLRRNWTIIMTLKNDAKTH